MRIQEYIDSLPQLRKKQLESIRSLIKSIYPQAKESMKYKMPTYQLGDGWVAVANQKHYVSLYTCSADHIKDFKKKHPQIRTGKGCINFREKDSIPLSDLQTVIKRAMESNHS